MTEMTYDVVVLGAGAGGVPAAIRAAQLGGRVAVIESGNPGGLCMNKGCIPFGHMMEASNILGYLSLGKDMGLGFSEISRDYAALLKRQNELISFMRAGTMGMLSKNKVEIIEGKGQLADKDKVEVDGRIVSFKNLILATGAEWLKPDFPGSDLEEVMNSDDLLGAGELPERVLLYGRSPWLIEIAQFLYRFGSQVTLATKESRILSDESKTISSRLAKVLKNQGISILAKAEILSLKKKKDGLHSVLSVKGKEETMVVHLKVWDSLPRALMRIVIIFGQMIVWKPPQRASTPSVMFQLLKKATIRIWPLREGLLPQRMPWVWTEPWSRVPLPESFLHNRRWPVWALPARRQKKRDMTW